MNPQTTNTTICAICHSQIYRSTVDSKAWFHREFVRHAHHKATPADLPLSNQPADIEEWLES